jgi:hypothetical protein
MSNIQHTISNDEGRKMKDQCRVFVGRVTPRGTKIAGEFTRSEKGHKQELKYSHWGNIFPFFVCILNNTESYKKVIY